jgi:hypothetical protein
MEIIEKPGYHTKELTSKILKNVLQSYLILNLGLQAEQLLSKKRSEAMMKMMDSRESGKINRWKVLMREEFLV